MLNFKVAVKNPFIQRLYIHLKIRKVISYKMIGYNILQNIHNC